MAYFQPAEYVTFRKGDRVFVGYERDGAAHLLCYQRIGGSVELSAFRCEATPAYGLTAESVADMCQTWEPEAVAINSANLRAVTSAPLARARRAFNDEGW